jgi:hypothetical protein
MRSASGSTEQANPARRKRAGFAVLAALAAVALFGSPARAAEMPSAAVSWWGGRYFAPTGESLTVYVSHSYPVDEAMPREWAQFFAGLIHGPELRLLTVYVATAAEVVSICGDPDASGCYANQRLVMIGDSSSGEDPTEIAAHEYGHHVAHNRVNPPWSAIHWGTKRWASHAQVCARAAAGTVFPGNEDGRYRLNPGEGFAEAYRVLNEARAGGTLFAWSIVDHAFFPDAKALAAVEDDVVRPWTAPVTTTIAGRLRATGSRTWARALTTSLDGDVTVTLRVPLGGVYDLALLGADGRKVLARGLWSGTSTKTARFTVCGQRTLAIRVVARGAGGRFSLRVTGP